MVAFALVLLLVPAGEAHDACDDQPWDKRALVVSPDPELTKKITDALRPRIGSIATRVCGDTFTGRMSWWLHPSDAVGSSWSPHPSEPRGADTSEYSRVKKISFEYRFEMGDLLMVVPPPPEKDGGSPPVLMLDCGIK